MNAEVMEWLTRNRQTLVDRAPHEIAHLAVVCGFEIGSVCEALSHWAIDAKTHTTQSHRAQHQEVRLMVTLKNRVGDIDLAPQWRAYVKKAVLGRDFDE